MSVQGTLWLVKSYPSTLISIFFTGIRYFSYQVATHLSSRGCVDPVPDPILPKKILGYGRESNPGPLGLQSGGLTTIPKRSSTKIIKFQREKVPVRAQFIYYKYIIIIHVMKTINILYLCITVLFKYLLYISYTFDCLFGIVVSTSDCHLRGPRFNSRLYPRNFPGSIGSGMRSTQLREDKWVAT